MHTFAYFCPTLYIGFEFRIQEIIMNKRKKSEIKTKMKTIKEKVKQLIILKID